MGELTNFLNSFKRDIQSPIGIDDSSVNKNKCYSSEYYEKSYITNSDIDKIINIIESSTIVDVNNNSHEVINKNDICVTDKTHSVDGDINYGNGHYYISSGLSSDERITESEIDALTNN